MGTLAELGQGVEAVVGCAAGLAGVVPAEQQVPVGLPRTHMSTTYIAAIGYYNLHPTLSRPVDAPI